MEDPAGHTPAPGRRVDRDELAKLLLENGADPNILAGNGLTALDMAEAAKADDVATLIVQHDGKLRGGPVMFGRRYAAPI